MCLENRYIISDYVESVACWPLFTLRNIFRYSVLLEDEYPEGRVGVVDERNRNIELNSITSSGVKPVNLHLVAQRPNHLFYNY
jgi:hypothetical protein